MAHSFNIGRTGVLARRAVAAAVLAHVGLVAGVASAEEPAFAGPRLIVRQPEVDFGDVVRGEKLEATFVLENIGGEPLKVLRAEPG